MPDQFEQYADHVLSPFLRYSEEMKAIVDRCVPNYSIVSPDIIAFGTPKGVVETLEDAAVGYALLEHEMCHLHLTQVKALEYSIEQLSEPAATTMRSKSCIYIFAKDAPRESGIEWFALDAELRATKDRLDKKQIKKLVGELKRFRRIYEEVHRLRRFGLGSIERWLAHRATLRAIYSFSRVVLTLRCSAESFSIGTAAEFERGAHFLNDIVRKTSLLWGRVVASLSDQTDVTRLQSVPI